MKNIKFIIRLILWLLLITTILTVFNKEVRSFSEVSYELIKNRKSIPELEKYRQLISNLSGGALGYDKNIPLTWMSERFKAKNPHAAGVCYGFYHS